MLITEEPTVEEKKSEKVLIAVIVAVALNVALVIIFLIIEFTPTVRDEPELIAKVVGPTAKKELRMEKRSVMKQIKQSTATNAAAPITRMMRANSAAKMVAPKVSRVSSAPIGLGEGEFGAGFGGSSAGMGSGVSFFGTRSSGRRILFVLDHSASMTDSQEKLRNRELAKALKGLSRGVQYQVILFGGGALFAEPGWKSLDIASRFEVTDPNKKKYTFTQFRGVNDWQFEGTIEQMPRANWLSVSPSNIERSLSVLDDIDKFFGTDWEIALRIAHLMRPSPDVIYFMSDGSGGNAPGPILETNRKYGRPRINTFAMETTEGARQFHEIAKSTGGQFMIIKGEGDAVKITDPTQLPSLF